jgi:hypothetical protein
VAHKHRGHSVIIQGPKDDDDTLLYSSIHSSYRVRRKVQKESTKKNFTLLCATKKFKFVHRRRRRLTTLRANKFVQFIAPFTLLQLRHQRVKPRRCARSCNLAQGRDCAERASLKLGRALQVLLDRVLANRRPFHAGLEQRRGLAQALRDRGRGERCKTEENHVADNLDLVGNVCEADEDVGEQFVQVKLRQRRV